MLPTGTAAGSGGRRQKAVQGGSAGKQQQWALRLRVWRRGDGGGERERRARRGSYEGRRVTKTAPSAGGGGGGEGERGLSVVDGLVDGLCLSVAGALHEHTHIYQSALLAPPRQPVAVPTPTLATSTAPAPPLPALAPLREAMCRAAALGAPGASRFHSRLAMPAWALARFARLLVRMVARLLPLAPPPLLFPPQAADGAFTIVVGLAADATATGVAADVGLNARGAARESSGAAGTGQEGGGGDGDGGGGGGGGKVHGGTGWEGGKVHGGDGAAAAVAAAAAAALPRLSPPPPPQQPLLLLSVGGGAVGGACHMPPSAGGLAVAASDGSGTAPLELMPLLEALAAHGRLAETAPPPPPAAPPAPANTKVPLLATPATPRASLAVAATAAAAVATVVRSYARPSYAAPAAAEEDDGAALSRSQQAWGEAMLPLAPVLRRWRRRLLLAPPLPSAPQLALGWALGAPAETSSTAAAAAVAMPMAPATLPASSTPPTLPSLLESFIEQAARHLHERGLGRLLARPSVPAEGSRQPTPPQQRRGCGATSAWAGTAATDAPSWRTRLNKSRMPPPSLDTGAAAGDRLLERPGSACGGGGGGGGGCGSTGGSGGDEGAAWAGVELLLASRAGCLRLLRLSPGGAAEKGMEGAEGAGDEEEGEEGGGVACCTSLLLSSAPSAEAEATPPITASSNGGRRSGGGGGEGGGDARGEGGGEGGVITSDSEAECRPPDEPDDLEEELDAAWYDRSLRLRLALNANRDPNDHRRPRPQVHPHPRPRPRTRPRPLPPSTSANPSPNNPNPTLNPHLQVRLPRCPVHAALRRVRERAAALRRRRGTHGAACFVPGPTAARTHRSSVRRGAPLALSPLTPPTHPPHVHRLRAHTLPQAPNSPTRQPQRTRAAATRRPAGLPLLQICVELPELVGSAAQRRGTLADFLDFVVATPASLDSLAPSMPNSPGGRASPAAFELPTAETELRQTAETLRFHPCGRAGAVSFSLPPPYEAYACLVWVVSAPTAPSTSAAAAAAAAAAAPAPAAAAAAAVAAAVAPHAAVAEPVVEAATELAAEPATDPKGAEMKIEPKRLATAVAEAIGAVARAAVEGAMSAESAPAAVAAVAADKAAADKAPPDRLAAAPAAEASALAEATEAEAAEAAGVAEVAGLPAATAADEAEEAPCRLALMLVGPRGSEPGLVAGEAEKERAAAAAAAAAAGGAASGAASGGGRVSEGAEHNATAHSPVARRAAARQLATQLVEEGLRSRWARYRSFSVWRQLNGGGAPAG